MSVRRWKVAGQVGAGRWCVDIHYRHADGTKQRIRKFPREQTRQAALQLEATMLRRLEAGERAFGTTQHAAYSPPNRVFVVRDRTWWEYLHDQTLVPVGRKDIDAGVRVRDVGVVDLPAPLPGLRVSLSHCDADAFLGERIRGSTAQDSGTSPRTEVGDGWG